MESTALNEPIEVVIGFTRKGILPLRFRWREHIYRIQRVEGTWQRRKGSCSIYSFSVTTENGNAYEIEWDTQSMQWRLRKIWDVEIA